MPEEHDRLATRLRRTALALRVTAQGYSFCSRFVLPPGGFPVASWTSSGSPSETCRGNLRRDRPKETYNPEVNQPSLITVRRLENARMAISTHGGIGTQHPASRPVWRYAANSRRDRTQDIPRGTHDGREQTHDIPIESHDRHRTNTAPRESRPAPADRPRAHNPFCRSYNRPNATLRRRTIHDPAK